MGEGVMVFIPVFWRFLEKKLKKLSKTYEFSLVAGISTDSYDLLGLITYYDLNDILVKRRDWLKAIDKFKNKKYQRPPRVSYKNLNSPSKLKNFLNNKELPNLKKRKVLIYDFKYLGKRTIKR